MRLGCRRTVVAAVAGVACAVATARSTPDAAPDLCGVGLGLHAGRDDSLAQYEDFGRWLGRAVDYRVVFCDPTKWEGIASPWFLGTTETWLKSRPERVEVISVPLLPKSERGAFEAIASGERDRYFERLAQTLSARRIASRVIIRLGWEGNGDWYPWSYLRDPAGYRTAFRRVVETMRSIAPELRFEWCVSCRAPRRGGAHWAEGYPGDDVVDIVSMDVYDHWSPGWESTLGGDAGLREFRAFAVGRGKPEAYPEWGCSTDVEAQGGGDDPTFIEAMAAWFCGRPGGILYQAYWNTSSGGPNAAIYGPNAIRVPGAAAGYRRLFGTEMRRAGGSPRSRGLRSGGRRDGLDCA